jgi:hypothetical protein
MDARIVNDGREAENRVDFTSLQMGDLVHLGHGKPTRSHETLTIEDMHDGSQADKLVPPMACVTVSSVPLLVVE